jgi:hypothetical protein
MQPNGESGLTLTWPFDPRLHIRSFRFNIFENMVIAEALKYSFNRGKRSNLYFYRDSRGNEVDLLLANGSELFPVEIKAGMTITRDYFKGLNHFAKLFPDQIPKGGGLVYGGESAQQRSTVSIVPFQAATRLFDLATAPAPDS